MTILLRMDDKMNRQLTCPVSRRDSAPALARELVQLGFIHEVSPGAGDGGGWPPPLWPRPRPAGRPREDLPPHGGVAARRRGGRAAGRAAARGQLVPRAPRPAAAPPARRRPPRPRPAAPSAAAPRSSLPRARRRYEGISLCVPTSYLQLRLDVVRSPQFASSMSRGGWAPEPARPDRRPAVRSFRGAGSRARLRA